MSKRRVLTNLDYIELESGIKEYVDDALSNVSADKDWDQNDESAADYIKNRTHWKEERFITHLESITLEGVEANTTYSGSTLFIDLIPGNTYIVDFNGTKYTCVAKQYTDWPYIGNDSILNKNDGADTGEPFFIHTYRTYSYAEYAMTVSGNITISIDEIVDEYHTINKSYLPKLVGEDTTGKIYESVYYNGETFENVEANENAEVFNNYNDNVATGQYSHAEGNGSIATGYGSHAEGSACASSLYAHAEGTSKASGLYSHAEGSVTKASGEDSHAEGWGSEASGKCSHAEGFYTTASNENSHAEGYYSTASGIHSHAEGEYSQATERDSHAEGYTTKAFGMYSHAEGYATTASGECSHAEGSQTTASGYASHAENGGNMASGRCSHAEGVDTKASSNYQHVQGKYNIEDTESKYAHIVGNGDVYSGIATYSNAHTLDWNGNAWYQGDVLVGGTSQDDASKLATETYVDTALANFSGGATDFNDMTATDTSGFLGTVNASVNAQTLMNDVMSRIAALEALAEELETI